MILSGHQPTYLPSLHLFNKIALSDAFMFVGHCQYSPKSWQARNNIRTGMLSVPVHKDFGQSIDQTKVTNSNWRRKHLRAIEICYSKRPFFKDYFPILEDRIGRDDLFNHLGNLNSILISDCLGWFGIKTKILWGDEYEITGHKTDMLISMSKIAGADEYLSNEGARSYVDEQKMQAAGIKHRWQKFTHPIYDQGHKEFIPNLSAIDLLFNCGPASGDIIRSCGHVD